VSPVFPKSRGPRKTRLPNVVPAAFAGNTLDTVRSRLWSTYWPNSHKWISQGVPRLENSFNIISVRYTPELLRNNSCIRYRLKTELLHLLLQKNISNRINILNGMGI
jgi:hypothetical protein